MNTTQFRLLPVSARPFSNVYIVDVTPELAKQWFDASRFNRKANYTQAV